MPGTIQVSVLEFKGISSSSSDLSETSLKVSMGKTHYQTWDKGDFSFTVTKLSEDLAVTLLDAGGNEIAYTGIQTREIIQKGTWDKIFNFEGGGFVHLKLQFALNEDERNRIRVMRESAMKKNLETASNINIKLSESSTLAPDSEETSTQSEQNVSDSQTRFKIEVVSREAEASQADLSLNSDVPSVGSTSSYQKEEGSIQERGIPNAADQSQDASSSTFTHETETQSPQVQERVPAEKIETYLPLADIRSEYKQGLSLATYAQYDSILKSKDQGSLEKTPSSVRKMISAFESGQFQDVKSLNRPLPVQPPLKIVGKEGSLEDQDDKVVTQSTDQSSRNMHQNLTSVSGLENFVSSDNEPSQVPKELESSVEQFQSTGNDVNTEDEITRAAPMELTAGKWNESPVDLMRQSTSETTTSSGRKFEEQYQEVQAYDSSNSSSSEGKESRSETEFESSTIIDIRGTSDRNSSYSEGKESRSETEFESSTIIDIRGTSDRNSSSSEGKESRSETEFESSAIIDIQGTSDPNSSSSEGKESRSESEFESSNIIDIQGISDHKTMSLEYYKEQYYFSESSGVWIFPHDTKRLCITTAGNEVLKIVGLQHVEANAHQDKENTLATLEKDTTHETEIASLPESGCGCSPDDSHIGLVVQVIKVAVIVGFGALVLLTRKKEPRKPKRKENDIFSIQNYVGERTNTE